jgi:hypothetical protein
MITVPNAYDGGHGVAFHLAGAVAEAGCQTSYTLPVDGAVCDQTHRLGKHILAHIPLRRAGQFGPQQILVVETAVTNHPSFDCTAR